MRIDEQGSWYKNTEFWVKYRPLMFDPDRIADTPIEAEGIIRLSGTKKGSDILDICCGEGRHDLEFARQGYNVTGVDITHPYIAEAERFAAELNLEAEFIEQDVLDFVRPESYDLALNFFSSFGYFEDQEDDLQLCKNACSSLRPGGVFLIDTMAKETVALKFRESEWFQRDGFIIMLESKLTDGWTHIENRWLFIRDDHSPDAELNEVKFSLRLYSAVEMASLLNEAGFSEVRFFGSLDGRPYDHKAERMVVVAVK